MFPSSQTGAGINSSFGLVPISGRSSSGSTDETRSLAFNWLGHLTGHGVGLFDEQQSGLKVSSDQIMDRSFMSIERHTPSVPRRTPHSNVGGSSSQPGADAPQPPHPLPDASMVNSYHPYRLVSDGLSAPGHPSLSTSQFAAFDSLYKAYQGAYGSAAQGSVFGTQPFRFDSPLLADQRMMLQASLLQYPHLGIFPNPALYPGIPGAGVRYPADYYGQNLPGMSLSSKYPDVGGPSWLSLDRPVSLLEREKEAKDGDRKGDLDHLKRQDKEDHHRSRPERDDMVSMRRDPKDEVRRFDDGRRDSAKHANDKKEQQKRSNSLKSPIRQEGHQLSSQDGTLNRCNSGGPNDFLYNSGRGGQVAPTFGMSADLTGLAKVSSSPGGTASQQRQMASKCDRTMEPVQDHAKAKDRHHHHHHYHHHHHNWKPEDGKTKAAPLVLTVPKTTASVSTNGQPAKPFEKKFHRPFEQAQMNSLPVEKLDRVPAHVQKDSSVKNSRGSSTSADYLARCAEAKTNENYRFLQHQQQQQQQRGGKTSEAKPQSHMATAKKQGTSGSLRCEEAPLNLVMTKSQNSSSASVVAVPVDVTESSPSEGCEFPRAHRVPVPPLLPPSVPHSDLGFLGQTWSLTSADDVRMLPRQVEGVLNSSASLVTAPSKASPPVSKLDLEAKRRVAMRKSESYNSDDDDDDERDEDTMDDAKDLARLLVISSGPPLKEPITVAKSNYLAMLGLVSLDTSKEIAFEQNRKRRKLFHERSITPVLVEESGEPEPENEGASFENELTHLDKLSFLGLLDLESVRSYPKKCNVAGQANRHDAHDFYRGHASSHSNDSAVTTLLNPSLPGCLPNSQYNFSALSQLDQKQQPEPYHSKEGCVGNALGSNAFDAVSDRRPFVGQSDTYFPGASGQGNGMERWLGVERDRQLSCDSKRLDIIKPQPDSHSAGVQMQEDYRQVMGGYPPLNSTNYGPCAKEGPVDTSPFTVNSRNASTPSSASKEVTNGQTFRSAEHQCREPAFHWPGLEAIIESYHHYVEEQTMEKQLLREQSQRLHHHNADLMFTAERLRTRMSELLHSKQQLLEERHKAQSLVDGLKDSMKQFL